MPKSAVRPILALLICLCPLLLAMGLSDGAGPTRIPEPQADYRVLLVDQQGTRVELSQFAIDGQSFVLGTVGQGQVAVPFEKVQALEFLNQDGQLKAKVTLKQGEPVSMTVTAALKATGKTGYGNFRIPLGEVSRVEFKGLAR
ncbi:MAG: hypothetical protein HY910_16890 [Desulfarculus sp.]|nr:hypothetical protein [Desulfarculus sp.]